MERGTAHLDPAKLDDCLRVGQPYYDKCQLDNAEFVQLRAVAAVCNQYFVGAVAEGGACIADTDCAPGDRGGFCLNGQCVSGGPVAPLPEAGDPCNADCDEGLVCSGADPSQSVCVAGPLAPVVSAAECAGTLTL